MNFTTAKECYEQRKQAVPKLIKCGNFQQLKVVNQSQQSKHQHFEDPNGTYHVIDKRTSYLRDGEQRRTIQFSTVSLTTSGEMGNKFNIKKQGLQNLEQ